MKTEDERYLSTRRYKEFCSHFPFQQVRKGMGLGNTLGALGVEFGGTGEASIDGVKKTATDLQSGTAVFTRIYQDIVTPGMVGGGYSASSEGQTNLVPNMAAFTSPKWFASYTGGNIYLDPGIYYMWFEQRFIVTERITMKLKSGANGTIRESPSSSSPYGSGGGKSTFLLYPAYSVASNLVTTTRVSFQSFGVSRSMHTYEGDYTSTSIVESGEYNVGEYTNNSNVFPMIVIGNTEKCQQVTVTLRRDLYQLGIKDNSSGMYPGVPFYAYVDTGRCSYTDTLYMHKLV